MPLRSCQLLTTLKQQAPSDRPDDVIHGENYFYNSDLLIYRVKQLMAFNDNQAHQFSQQEKLGSGAQQPLPSKTEIAGSGR